MWFCMENTKRRVTCVSDQQVSQYGHSGFYELVRVLPFGL